LHTTARDRGLGCVLFAQVFSTVQNGRPADAIERLMVETAGSGNEAACCRVWRSASHLPGCGARTTTSITELMHALVVVANPSPSSLSHAIAQQAASVLLGLGYGIDFHDLYAEAFDPVQPVGEAQNTTSRDPLVQEHCAHLARAHRIVVCHPNWWGQPPAILKGWIDRVFRLGSAYEYPPDVGYEGVPRGLLRARRAFVFNTSNTPAEREQAEFGDPLEALWRRCVFRLCGVPEVERRCFAPVSASSSEQRQEWLAEVANLVGSP
jgi:putative NADPH-quinone reductase